MILFMLSIQTTLLVNADYIKHEETADIYSAETGLKIHHLLLPKLIRSGKLTKYVLMKLSPLM